LSRTRIIVTAAGLLWLAHIGVTATLGTQSPGPFLSDAIQFSVGALLICALWDASRRSEGLARAFWNLATAGYLVWMIAQAMGLYNDFAGNPAIMGITNLLFSFWFVPLAMALYVFVLTNAAAIRNRGVGGYVAHYLKQPFSPKLFPINLFMNGIEEIIKPLTLTLRLFGNLFAGGLMLSLLAALVIWRLGPVPIGGVLAIPFTIVWKLFDMAIGAIQAFIFALLTILYFDTAMAPDEAH